MYDLPAALRLQQSHAKTKTGEELEVLGKYAAQQFVEGRYDTLNEAVVGSVKHAGLSPEQVKRVCEFANHGAFNAEFRKEGEQHKYVDFHGGVADPSAVLKDLNDGGGGTVFDDGLGDFHAPPPQRKTASVSRNFSALLREEEVKEAAARRPAHMMSAIGNDMKADYEDYLTSGAHPMGYDPFGEHHKMTQVRMLSSMTGRSPVVVKHAALDFSPQEAAFREAFHVDHKPDYPVLEPLSPALDLLGRLKLASTDIASRMTGLECDAQRALAGLYEQVKQAAYEGMELGQLMNAWHQVGVEPAGAKVAFAYAGPRLVEQGVFPSLDALGASLQKTAAQGLVDETHSLVTGALRLQECLVGIAKLAAELREVEDAQVVLNDVLQLGFGKEAGWAKNLADQGGLIKKITRGAGALGDKTAPAVTSAAETLFGTGSPTATVLGNTSGTLVRNVPAIVAGAGAVSAAKKLHDAGATRTVAGMIPGTRANVRKKQERAYRKEQRRQARLGGAY